METERTKLINDLKNIFENDSKRNIFKKFIEYIRFPFFKNFDKDLKITFNFPITFIVGENGSGKSSLLHALYGSPKGKSVEEYWYNTALDPIVDLKDNRHCFIYSFKTEYSKTYVEVIKTRIQNKNRVTGEINPDYWEPSRPLKKYGMSEFTYNGNKKEATKTRWKLITRQVHHLDFRYSLSAYDKYFYFGSEPNTKTLKSKKDIIRKYAPKLHHAFEHDTGKTYFSRSVSVPKKLTKKEIAIVGHILGKDYTEIKIAEHNFYDKNKGFALKYKTKNISYSEAYAGSGETALAKLVHDLVNTENYSLILLDEPETSLHPSAQKRLLDFILEQIKRKKLQVVISTHSPDIIEGMPKESIKILYEHSETGKIKIIEDVYSENAFIHIGRSFSDKKIIIVEDVLAKMIVERVIEELGDEQIFEVRFFHGGESRIKQESMLAYSKEGGLNHFVFFDGDQKRDRINIVNIAEKDKNVEYLKDKIMDIIGESIIFSIDGGRPDQEIELMLKYIKYHYENVFYLPKNIPEEIIWNDQFLDSFTIGSEEKDIIANELDYKKKFALYTKTELGENTAEDIQSIQKKFITNWIKKKNSDYNEIVDNLKKIKEK